VHEQRLPRGRRFGVCVDKCFDDMLGASKKVGPLDSNGCGSTELCVPCTLIQDKGLPGCL
jgi:hypothetical protein